MNTAIATTIRPTYDQCIYRERICALAMGVTGVKACHVCDAVVVEYIDEMGYEDYMHCRNDCPDLGEWLDNIAFSSESQ